MTLDSTGGIDIQATAVADAPPSARLAKAADIRIDSGDPPAVATRPRNVGLYDLALQGLRRRNHPCSILSSSNERGEVAEGARSNVFVERDGVLLPPLTSGALPGPCAPVAGQWPGARRQYLYPPTWAEISGWVTPARPDSRFV